MDSKCFLVLGVLLFWLSAIRIAFIYLAEYNRNSDNNMINFQRQKLNLQIKKIHIHNLTQSPSQLSKGCTRKDLTMASPFRLATFSKKHNHRKKTQKLIDADFLIARHYNFAADIIILCFNFLKLETLPSFSLSSNSSLSKITDTGKLPYGKSNGGDGFKLHKSKLTTSVYNAVFIFLLVRAVLFTVFNAKIPCDIYSTVPSWDKVSRTFAGISIHLRSVTKCNILLDHVKYFFLSQQAMISRKNYLSFKDKQWDQLIFEKYSYIKGTHVIVCSLYSMDRLASFRPLLQNDVSFIELSEAGFSYTGQSDIIVCVACRKTIHLRAVSTSPNNATYHNSGCEYIQQEATLNNGGDESDTLDSFEKVTKSSTNIGLQSSSVTTRERSVLASSSASRDEQPYGGTKDPVNKSAVSDDQNSGVTSQLVNNEFLVIPLVLKSTVSDHDTPVSIQLSSTDQNVNDDEHPHRRDNWSVISLVENTPVEESTSETIVPDSNLDYSSREIRRESFNQWTSVHPLDPDDLSDNFYFFRGPGYSVTCWRCKCRVHIPLTRQVLVSGAEELREGRPLPCMCYYRLQSMTTPIDVERNGQTYRRLQQDD